MKHSDPCPCKPWNEWLIETGAEDVEDEEEAPITADGEYNEKRTQGGAAVDPKGWRRCTRLIVLIIAKTLGQ